MDDRLPGSGRPVGTVRIDVRHERQMTLSSVCWEGEGLKFRVGVDEPQSRGGYATNPAPLSYFVLGSASCFLMQLAKISMLRELKVDSLALTARAHFDHKAGGAFTDITYDVDLSGTEEEGAILSLTKEADRQCFASNTLRKAVRLTTNVTYNGRRVAPLS